MIGLAGGTFLMGDDGPLAYPQEEAPVREVSVDPFALAATTVTVAQYAAFVQATGHRTDAEVHGNSLVFSGLVSEQIREVSPAVAETPWWRQVTGASWHRPEGPGSEVIGREDHPVTHVSRRDAEAYAHWVGGRLPSEAEWEFAARGGLEGAAFVWGDEKGQAARANTWQGVFPVADTGDDGHAAKTAPVGCFAANGYGLYDMAGNVWEWTRDWYAPGLEPADVIETGGPPQSRARDPGDPGLAKHVIKGGSFLCADDYCYRYRPAARTPGPPDSGASHLGFRTVLREAG